MLENILTKPELSALAKHKGITAGKLSREGLVSLLAERFFEPERVAGIYDRLTPDYQYLLHFLKVNQKPMELEDAARYFKSWNSIRSLDSLYTYLQAKDYRNIFSQLKEDLVIPGLVILIESSDTGRFSSKFERFKLYLPQGFSALLPPLPIKGEKKAQQGERHSFDDWAKNILLGSVGLGIPKGKADQDIINNLTWVEGLPRFKDQPIFQPFDLLNHIFSAWQEKKVVSHYPKDLFFIPNLIYLLQGLHQGEWLSLAGIEELFGCLTRFINLKEVRKMLPQVCDEAVALGLMERIIDSGGPFYRLQIESLALLQGSLDDTTKDSGLTKGLSVKKDDSVLVDPKQVSFFSLFEILLLSNWTQTPMTERLSCSPSMVKCGKVWKELAGFSKLRLFEYFSQKAALFQQVFEKVENDFGKFMIHTDLSFFEIGDITISILLQHTFPETFHPIGGNFFAVARADEIEILNFLAQKKYSVKIKGKINH